MAVDANGIRGFFGSYIGTPTNKQEQTQNQQKGPLEGDALAARISSMPLDEQAALAMALKTGDVGASASASAAKEVYDKAVSQAQFIAQSYGMKPQDTGYNEFIENYARQFYDQNIGLGIVSYDQAAELNRAAGAYEEDKKKKAYNSALADTFAGAYDNQRWKDIVYHIAGQDEKTSTYGQPSYYMSGQNGPQAVGWANTVGATQDSYANPVQNQTKYPDWFEEYYNNNQ